MMKKEEYIDRVLSSGKSLKTLEVSDFVWTRIQGKLTTVEEKVSMGKVWMISLGLAALFILNLTSLKQTTESNSSTSSNSSFFSNTTTDFYNTIHE